MGAECISKITCKYQGLKIRGFHEIGPSNFGFMAYSFILVLKRNFELY